MSLRSTHEELALTINDERLTINDERLMINDRLVIVGTQTVGGRMVLTVGCKAGGGR